MEFSSLIISLGDDIEKETQFFFPNEKKLDLTLTIPQFYNFLITFNNPKQFTTLFVLGVEENEDDNDEICFGEEDLKSILSTIDKVLPNYSNILEIGIDGFDLPDVNDEAKRIYDLHLYDRQQAN